MKVLQASGGGVYAFVTAEIDAGDAEVFCGLLGLGYNIGNSGLRIDVHGFERKKRVPSCRSFACCCKSVFSSRL
jgi:hypothetical protein